MITGSCKLGRPGVDKSPKTHSTDSEGHLQWELKQAKSKWLYIYKSLTYKRVYIYKMYKYIHEFTFTKCINTLKIHLQKGTNTKMHRYTFTKCTNTYMENTWIHIYKMYKYMNIHLQNTRTHTTLSPGWPCCCRWSWNSGPLDWRAGKWWATETSKTMKEDKDIQTRRKLTHV